MRLRWVVLAAALVLAWSAPPGGRGLRPASRAGSFDDPASESSRAADRIVQELGPQGADLVVRWSSDGPTVDEPAFRDPVAATVAGLRARPEITSVTTWYDTQAPALLSTDRRATYAWSSPGPPTRTTRPPRTRNCRPALATPGYGPRSAAPTAALYESNVQTTKDITRAEPFPCRCCWCCSC